MNNHGQKECGAMFAILLGELELRSDGEVPLLSSSSQSAKPGAQPRKSVQPDGSAFPQDKPLGPLVRQAEEEMEDGGLFIPTGRLFLFN
jgi:hypothetical protein